MEVNINSDLGESFGAWKMGDDPSILKIVRTANVACGFHAGDPLVMTDTVKLAVANDVSIGAHPSFLDIQGFGRRQIRMSSKELEATVAYQIGALQAIAAANGGRVTHVKAHGSLSNMASVEAEMAMAIGRAIKAVDPSLIFLVTAMTELSKAGRKLGLRTAEEIFADRTYTDDGNLTPRSQPNAMIHDGGTALANVRRMLEEQAIISQSGKRTPSRIDSICVHGDEPTAVAVAKTVREGLEAAQIRIVKLPDLKTMH
jgi:UPF0271 protein